MNKNNNSDDAMSYEIPDSPYKQTGLPLVEEKEMSCIGIMPMEKYPAQWCNSSKAFIGISDWQRFAKELPSEEQTSWWAETPSQNVGLCTGELSGVIALDYDYCPEMHEKIQAKVNKSPSGKVAKNGATYFYRYNGEQNKKWYHPENGEVVLELLSDGRQTVLPPSTHPDLMAYEWVGQSLLEIDIDDLPTLPTDFIEIVDEIVKGKNKNEKPTYTTVFKASEDDEQNIIEALKHIDADLPYPKWVKIAMAIHSWSKGTRFDIFHDWSKRGQKYTNEKDCQDKWDSFNLGRGTEIASLFWEAKSNGFVVSQQLVSDFELPEGFLENWTNNNAEIVEQEEQPKNVNMHIPPDIVANAPNLVGDIARWINDTAIYKQPELAMATAITLVGAIKGHLVKTETGLRTNIYMLGIAPASSGKGHGQHCSNLLLKRSKLDNLIGGKPVSDSGVLHMLEKGAVRICVWDEIGKAMQAFTNGNAQSFQAQILTLFMELFSSANTFYAGKEYAKKEGKENKRHDVQFPCLSLLGMTTKEPLLDALNYEMIADGFMSRFLAVEPREPYPKRNRGVKDFEPPESLIEDILALRAFYGDENLGKDNVAQVVPFTKEAKALMESIEDSYDDMKRDYDKSGKRGFPSLWGRASEHIAKIALTVSKGSYIQESDVLWASELVKASNANMIAISENIDRTEFGKNIDKLREKIDSLKTAMPLGTFRNRLRYVYKSSQEIDNAIKFLVDTGDAFIISEKSKNNHLVKKIAGKKLADMLKKDLADNPKGDSKKK